MDETEKRLDSLCSRILESDKAIRFVPPFNGSNDSTTYSKTWKREDDEE